MMKNFRTDQFSWQKLTAKAQLPLTLKLNQQYDTKMLKAETDALFQKYSAKEQHGRYHSGGWDGICLHAANGDYTETRLLSDAEFSKTEVLGIAPYFESIIDGFNCDKLRIRLMKLAPEKNIFWHYDRTDSLDEETVRLHIPVFTDAKVLFQISHEDCVWREGELWYGDFSFPHRLYNGWADTRVHLVMDLMVNEKIESLFPKKFLTQKNARLALKQEVHKAFKRYDLPNKVKAKITRAFKL